MRFIQVVYPFSIYENFLIFSLTFITSQKNQMDFFPFTINIYVLFNSIFHPLFVRELQQDEKEKPSFNFD